MGYLSKSFCEYFGRILTFISGSYRAQHYAAKYPDRAGNFVVDAVTAPGMVSNPLKEMVKILTLLRLFSIKPIPGYWQETEHCCGPMRIARMIQTVPSGLKGKAVSLPCTVPFSTQSRTRPRTPSPSKLESTVCCKTSLFFQS